MYIAEVLCLILSPHRMSPKMSRLTDQLNIPKGFDIAEEVMDTSSQKGDDDQGHVILVVDDDVTFHLEKDKQLAGEMS